MVSDRAGVPGQSTVVGRGAVLVGYGLVFGVVGTLITRKRDIS